MTYDVDAAQRQHVLRRFFELAPRDRLRVYREIRDDLAESVRETKADKTARLRAEAVEAIAEAARQLNLPAGTAPSPEQFNAVRPSGWNSTRVLRAWGRWRWAKAAYLGTLPESARQRARRKAVAAVPRSTEDPFETLRQWMASKPAPSQMSPTHYDDWAREANEARPAGSLPFPSNDTISRVLDLSWPAVRDVALGKVRYEDAPRKSAVKKRRVFRAPHDLVGTPEVAEILNVKRARVTDALLVRADFPRPVWREPAGIFWLRQDIEAFKRNRSTATRENELRREYVTAEEVRALSGYSATSIRRHQTLGFPAPVVDTSGLSLWLRADIEAWTKQRQQKEPTTKKSPAKRHSASG